jgi:predicted TIM-barrel fold metal-dependent hydrolase
MPNDLRVVDMWAPIVPSREIIEHVAEHFPPDMLGYLRVFQRGEPTLDGFGELCRALARDDASIAAIAARHPDRFIPFAGADILRGAEAVRELERWVRERGFRGLSLRPFMIGLPADDRHYYPFYAKCIELDIPLSIHASANWTTTRPSELGHPRHLDRVACDFPELRLVLSHAGYPWVLEACLLAWKHPNLYLELAAHRPRYFTAPGAGWDPLLRLGQTTVQDKILYGTGAFLLGRSPAELIDELRALPLKPEVLEKWLWRNATALLGLDSDAAPGAGPQ